MKEAIDMGYKTFELADVYGAAEDYVGAFHTRYGFPDGVCVAVCCSVLQCVAVCCSVFHCVAVCCSVLQYDAVCCILLQCVTVCCRIVV